MLHHPPGIEQEDPKQGKPIEALRLFAEHGQSSDRRSYLQARDKTAAYRESAGENSRSLWIGKVPETCRTGESSNNNEKYPEKIKIDIGT